MNQYKTLKYKNLSFQLRDNILWIHNPDISVFNDDPNDHWADVEFLYAGDDSLMIAEIESFFGIKIEQSGSCSPDFKITKTIK